MSVTKRLAVIQAQATTQSNEMARRIKIEIGSGNVFADLGFKNPQEHLAKARIASRIYDIISARGITQKAASGILGVDQPRISDLLHGRVRRFSTEKLLQFLLALGQDVEIIISPCRAKNRKASLRVSSMARRTKIHGTKAA